MTWCSVFPNIQLDDRSKDERWPQPYHLQKVKTNKFLVYITIFKTGVEFRNIWTTFILFLDIYVNVREKGPLEKQACEEKWLLNKIIHRTGINSSLKRMNTFKRKQHFMCLVLSAIRVTNPNFEIPATIFNYVCSKVSLVK